MPRKQNGFGNPKSLGSRAQEGLIKVKVSELLAPTLVSVGMAAQFTVLLLRNII